MHKTIIPNWAIERGQLLNNFPTIDTGHTALLVIDLQNFFMVEGQAGASSHARDIVPCVNDLIIKLRIACAQIVFTRHSFSNEGPAALPNWQRQTPLMQASAPSLVPGNYSHELYSKLNIGDEDWIINKYRFSCFIPGSSDMHERLQAAEIDTIVIAGAMTNVCCESTARDAMMLGYRVLFISDATAAKTDEEHNSALLNLQIGFADVISFEELLTRIP